MERPSDVSEHTRALSAAAQRYARAENLADRVIALLDARAAAAGMGMQVDLRAGRDVLQRVRLMVPLTPGERRAVDDALQACDFLLPRFR